MTCSAFRSCGWGPALCCGRVSPVQSGPSPRPSRSVPSAPGGPLSRRVRSVGPRDNGACACACVCFPVGPTPPNNQSINQSCDLPIDLSIDLAIYLSIYLSIHPSIYRNETNSRLDSPPNFDECDGGDADDCDDDTHTNTWPYHARIRSTPKLALRRGPEARPARSRRMASAEGRRWQSLAQPFVCSS